MIIVFSIMIIVFHTECSYCVPAFFFRTGRSGITKLRRRQGRSDRLADRTHDLSVESLTPRQLLFLSAKKRNIKKKKLSGEMARLLAKCSKRNQEVWASVIITEQVRSQCKELWVKDVYLSEMWTKYLFLKPHMCYQRFLPCVKALYSTCVNIIT